MHSNNFSFFSSNKVWVFVFFDNNFENLIENFLNSYFKYSHLAWLSVIFSLSKIFRVFAIWAFILSTKSEFKANELLNLHKVKINGEWSEVKTAKMSVFLTLNIEKILGKYKYWNNELRNLLKKIFRKDKYWHNQSRKVFW